MQGRIHSLETMGMVDGPGIRSVVFLQGCPLRCIYCHNPDAQAFEGGTLYSAKDLVSKLTRYKNYYGNKGGVTLSGGEPLFQAEFAKELFTLLKEKNIGTCIDTSGYFPKGCEDDIRALLSVTDLVILDIKHYSDEPYKEITGKSFERFNSFRTLLCEMGVPIWLRHVVVPGLTDSPTHIAKLKEYMAGFPNVKKKELLPYHNLGEYKYEKLGIPYKLKGTPPMDKEKLKKLQNILCEEQEYAH